MESIDAGCSRVDVEHVQGLVVLYFQDVGVAANEELWWSYKQVLADGCVVFPRIATDVLKKYVGSFDGESV